MNRLEIQMRTLTPLWTGGAKGSSAQPRETGLLGSMRWWYEGILRGMGGRVCDATADETSHRCIYKREKGESFEQAFAKLCLACRLFGCTGWRRRFRLEVDGLAEQDLFFVTKEEAYPATSNWLWNIFGGEKTGGGRVREGRTTTYTIGSKALWGENAMLTIVPLGGDSEATLAKVSYLLDTVARWGALGAKPQHGFGQFQIVQGLDPLLVEEGRELVRDDARQTPGSRVPAEYFDVGSFFSHVYELPGEPYRGGTKLIGDPPAQFDYRQHFVPCAFDIRFRSRVKDFQTGEGENFGMRFWFRDWLGETEIHRQFGRTGERQADKDKSASRVFVSHLYRLEPNGPWQLKVWGHVPTNLKDANHTPVSVADVTAQVTKFLQAMFPGIKLMHTFDRKEVLGL